MCPWSWIEVSSRQMGDGFRRGADGDERQLSAESPGEIDRAARGVDGTLGVWLLEKLPGLGEKSRASL